jgi:hypothetical protein
MTTARTLYFPDLFFAPSHGARRKAALQPVAQRLRTLFARIASYFESYDDYFAEIERSLPERVREERRQRKQVYREVLIASLCR